MSQAFLHLTSIVSHTEEPASLGDLYCASKQVQSSRAHACRHTRGLSFGGGKTAFETGLQNLGELICKGLRAEHEDAEEITPGVTFEHFEVRSFAALRQSEGIDEVEFLQSLSKLHGGATEASGKSGSLFWFSDDRRFVLKSVTKREFQKLLDILPRYMKHMQAAQEANRPCLISRFFGAYLVKAGGRELHLVALNNVFQHGLPQRIYDLKGTTEDRFVLPSPGKVMKDGNFTDFRLCLRGEQAEAVAAAVEADTAFLEEENIMDYSLLLGVYEETASLASAGDDHESLLEGLEVEEEEEELYQERRPAKFGIGIIDVLVEWSLKKKVAHWLKKTTIGCCHEIDTEPPDYYRRRFVHYVEEKIGALD